MKKPYFDYRPDSYDLQARAHPVEWDFSSCDNCGRTCHIDDLDAKPNIMPNWAWRWLPPPLVLWLLDRAADMGLDFTRLECSRCYGHGFEAVGSERNG